jgi:hypothetical protein
MAAVDTNSTHACGRRTYQGVRSIRARPAGAKFRIAGRSRGSPIAITAVGANEICQWLALLIKSFQLTDCANQSIIIDGAKAAVHWRTTVYSRITGTRVPSELIDLVKLRRSRIASYTEFFVSRYPLPPQPFRC